jgi:hypothetical protein
MLINEIDRNFRKIPRPLSTTKLLALFSPHAFLNVIQQHCLGGGGILGKIHESNNNLNPLW